MYVLARSFLKFWSWNRWTMGWTTKRKETNLKPESLRVIFKEFLRKLNAIWDSNLENSVLRTLSNFQEAITFQIPTYFSVQNNNFAGTFINFEKKCPHSLLFFPVFMQIYPMGPLLGLSCTLLFIPSHLFGSELFFGTLLYRLWRREGL